MGLRKNTLVLTTFLFHCSNITDWTSGLTSIYYAEDVSSIPGAVFYLPPYKMLVCVRVHLNNRSFGISRSYPVKNLLRSDINTTREYLVHTFRIHWVFIAQNVQYFDRSTRALWMDNGQF
ncbi:hypothetical protein OUZ56_026453 [Daphnia magna]|uniref:Uncharacterized protein n=1 Tax=Daphnia magna TaxID=35525 RepID=A0ABQ9ZMK5_9CRUS|nr:hypothetical protein OUZ56_026453 [Daphnia magna]